MAFFTDNRGWTWHVAVTYDTVCRVRELLGVDLLAFNYGEPPLWQKLQSDDALLCDVLFVVCGGAPDRRFGKGLRGVIQGARWAFYDAWIAFFPEPTEDDEQPPRRPKPVDFHRAVWERAGIVGIHPGPYTLRQLMLMSEARLRYPWQHTSNLMALLANINRDSRKRASFFSPAEFDPYRPKPKPQKVSIDVFFADMWPKNAQMN